MLERIMGVAMLKAPIYKSIAEDKTATTPAAIIVVVMAIIGGILGAISIGIAGSFVTDPAQLAQLGSPVGTAIKTIVSAIIGWLIGSWVFAFVAGLFGGKTNTSEMLRVFGFTQIFQILGIIPCIGGIAALVLSVIGAIIGIREAAEFDTTKAIVTGVVGLVVLFIVSAIVGTVLALIGLV
jgi:hypothetical protein